MRNEEMIGMAKIERKNEGRKERKEKEKRELAES